jgi:predicted Zn-dependent peptidase
MFEIDPQIFSLSNGLRVVFQKRDVFVAHLAIMFKAGSRYEEERTEGLAHYVEHTIFKGTGKRDSLQILTELDSVGGELNAYTNKEELCLHASFRKVHLPIAAALLGDIVLDPVFPEEELLKEKEVIKDEINSYLDSPSERILDEFEANLFQHHPLGYNILGSAESLDRITREDTLKFVRQHFTADNAVISVVGDLDEKELLDLLEVHFGALPKTTNVNSFKNYEAQSYFKFDKKEPNANYQAHLLIGGLAPVKTASDRRTMTLLMNYLGGPAMNARLSMLIREKHGYAYNIEANFTPYADVGFWTIYAGTDPKYIEKTLKLIDSEMRTIVAEGISETDLEQAKEQLKGHVSLSLDSNMELLLYAAKSLLFHDRIDSVKSIYKQIDSISMTEIRSIISSIYSTEKVSSLIYDLR